MSRRLKAELSNFIRARIPLTDDQIKNAHPMDVFIMAMTALSGITEATGNNDGPLVNDIQYTVGDGTGASWCMATVQSCIRFVELYCGVTSTIPCDDNCVETYNTSPDANKISDISKVKGGDIIIFEHGDTQAGHTEIVLGNYLNQFFYAMGGNSGPGPGYTGYDGVFAKMRSAIQTIGNMHIIGYLRPFL